uniref:Uncharacterized protein n=1 Tax=Zooxanthella nutricula TaxID=1333877 RepID=A0A7S2PPR4_9DINO
MALAGALPGVASATRDASAGASPGAGPPSSSRLLSWHAAEGPHAAAGDIPLTAEEIRRRAREWVNRTVPMLEDDEDSSPPLSSRENKVGLWDSDEEGVETRTRVEAQPEAGAGGPDGGVPFFMQVLNKQGI